MKIIFFLLWIGFSFPLFAYSILFVHIGDHLPSHLETAVKQARLFNPQADLILIANERALSEGFCSTYNLKQVPCESLIPTQSHNFFTRFSPLQGFWKVTSERFFFLQEWMARENAHEVFHLESDVMLYVDLAPLIPIFHEHYPQLGATFHNDKKCIAGILYLSTPKAATDMADWMAFIARRKLNDMEFFPFLRSRCPEMIGFLPILPLEYVKNAPMKTRAGSGTPTPELYANHLDVLGGIFDTATLGQYFDGVDPHFFKKIPSYTNTEALFDPAEFTYEKKGPPGKKIYYLKYNGREYPIYSIHVHSKNLVKFES